eukprot:148215-Ditylum_brightwellii.AAC.1
MKATNTNLISGNKWHTDVILQDLMTFIGIMFLSTLDPTPGCELNYLFQHPKKYPYTQAMTFT